MQILLLADIHGNYPALRAIDAFFSQTSFDAIVNCGDSVVFAPFSNEVINWLIARKTISILGNTDKKVIKLLQGQTFAKPSKEEKRIMYFHAARQLSRQCGDYLQSLGISAELPLTPIDHDPEKHKGNQLGIFHGSPAKPHEFLFDTTPRDRFAELARDYPYKAIVTGHSHTPYHFEVNGTHFINPGSAGRMFDGNPAVGCAVLTCKESQVEVQHYRIDYDVPQVVAELARQQLPQIYQAMYLEGKKLN
ncbi:metallophosphoesterase family protein [Desulfopila aestuarii]|nr:metallophosphoesterase family protein [Desulfopila aestuarii]